MIARYQRPYQRPRPYKPPPPSNRTRTTMMRIVVISMCSSYRGAIFAHRMMTSTIQNAFDRLLFLTAYQLAQMNCDQKRTGRRSPRCCREGRCRRLMELRFGCELADPHLQASFAVTPPDRTVSPPTFLCCRPHRRDRQLPTIYLDADNDLSQRLIQITVREDV